MTKEIIRFKLLQKMMFDNTENFMGIYSVLTTFERNCSAYKECKLNMFTDSYRAYFLYMDYGFEKIENKKDWGRIGVELDGYFRVKLNIDDLKDKYDEYKKRGKKLYKYMIDTEDVKTQAIGYKNIISHKFKIYLNIEYLVDAIKMMGYNIEIPPYVNKNDVADEEIYIYVRHPLSHIFIFDKDNETERAIVCPINYTDKD